MKFGLRQPAALIHCKFIFHIHIYISTVCLMYPNKMNKHKSTVTPGGFSAKKPQKAIDISTKFKIIRDFEGGMKEQTIASCMSKAHLTKSTIVLKLFYLLHFIVWSIKQNYQVAFPYFRNYNEITKKLKLFYIKNRIKCILCMARHI